MAFFRRRNTSSQVPVTAAPAAAPRRTRQKPLRDIDWQARIRRYDDEGPGIVGQYLDLRSFLGSSAASVVKLDTGSKGSVVLEDSPMSTNEERALLTLIHRTFLDFRNATQTPQQLVYELCRALSGVGEVAIGFVPGHGWVAAQSTELSGGTNPNEWVWRDHNDMPRPFRNPMRIYTPNLAKGKRSEAASPLKRALPDIERYVIAAHGQIRPLASRLVANGIVRVPFPRDPDANDDLLYDLLDAADSDVLDLRYMGSAIKDGRRLVPYFLEGDEPLEWTDIGRPLDQGLFQMEESALKAFARSVSMPLKLILEGPGNAKYSNEDVLMSSFLRQDIQALINLVYDAITLHVVRPRLQNWAKLAHTKYAASPTFGWKLLRTIDPDRITLAGDVESMIMPENKAQLLLDAYKLGIVARAEVARALGAEMIDFPDGWSEAAIWQLINGSWTGDGKPGNNLRGDPGLNGPQMPQQVTAPPAVAALTPAPPAPPPPALPPKVAAVAPVLTTRPGEVLAIERILAETDSVAVGEIVTWFSGMVEQSRTALAAAAMRSLPDSDPDRVALRGSPPEAIFEGLAERVEWGSLAASIASKWEVGGLGEIIAKTHHVVASLAGPLEGPDLEAAAKVARGQGVRWLAKAASGKVNLPVGAAVEVLMAAAGAEVDPKSWRLLRTPDGGAVLDGQPWRAGTGYAASAKVAAALAAEHSVAFEWRHSFYREPVEPVSAHAELSGEIRTSGEPTYWDDRAPHDHGPFCSCALLLRLELREPVAA